MIAEVLVRTYSLDGSRSLMQLVQEPTFRELSIYEAQAAGPLNALLRTCPHYLCSEFFPDVTPGSIRNGVRCEDLQALSFVDSSLDLVLHGSVLEHLPRPDDAFVESFRVLRDGGYTIFEVPMTDPGVVGLRSRSIVRVDTSSGKDVHLLEPVYYDDPLNPEGALVYTDFGVDIEERLRKVGFHVQTESRSLDQSSMSHSVVVVARKPQSAQLPI